MVRQRARGVERLNQPLKRKLLVAIRRKIARTHPPNQITEARMARRVRAQHQRVDEKPDQILQRTVRAPRYRTADRDVIARTKPAQQRRQPSLQHQEPARALPRRNPRQGAMQVPPRPKHTAPAAIARYRRPPTFARQRDLLRKSTKPMPPVRKLPPQNAPAIALIPQ